MLSLVPLTLEDGEALERIHAACFPDSWNKAAFDPLLQDNLTCGWLALSNSNPVGFILARVVGQEAEILTFAVKPSSQRMGIGRRLLKELMIFLNSINCKKIFLEVAIDNKAAMVLYASAGFVIIVTRLNYYSRRDQASVAASVMAWTLEENE